MTKITSIALWAALYGTSNATAAMLKGTANRQAAVSRELQTGCAPAYTSGGSYAAGEVRSAAVSVTTPAVTDFCNGNDSPNCVNGRIVTTPATTTQVTHNFACGEAIRCGQAGYGPGEQYSAWTKQAACTGTATPASFAPAQWSNGGCPGAYTAGTDYDPEDVVSVQKTGYSLVFQCKAAPNNLFCGQGGYEPGVGQYSSTAWTQLGSCSGQLSPTTSPNFSALTAVGGCPQEWAARSGTGTGGTYEEGDMVSVTLSTAPERKAVYKCKAWPQSGYCHQFSPTDVAGGALGWESAGSCSGTIGPTKSPTFTSLTEVGDGCPPEYMSSSTAYKAGDQVAVGKVVYECHSDVHTSKFCADTATNMSPGELYGYLGWTLKGYCDNTKVPTSAPTRWQGFCVFRKAVVNNSCSRNAGPMNGNRGSTACSCTSSSPPGTYCTQSTVTYPFVEAWRANAGYATGDVARVGRDKYVCRYPGWCDQSAYEPATSAIWSQAWTKSGSCGVYGTSNTPSVFPSASPTKIPTQSPLGTYQVATASTEYTLRLEGSPNCDQEDLASRIKSALQLPENAEIKVLNVNCNPGLRRMLSGLIDVIFAIIVTQECSPTCTSAVKDNIEDLARSITSTVESYIKTDEFANALNVTSASLLSQPPKITIQVESETHRPTASPTASPTMAPTGSPTTSDQPSLKPSQSPSDEPSLKPSQSPSDKPSQPPSNKPSQSPSDKPSLKPSQSPSNMPSLKPSQSPSDEPSLKPSQSPSDKPSQSPSDKPSQSPSDKPSLTPSQSPNDKPSQSPSDKPSLKPSQSPSNKPSQSPSNKPSLKPSQSPSDKPSQSPSDKPSLKPSQSPSNKPSQSPSNKPSQSPSVKPSLKPSQSPSDNPSQSPSDKPSLKPSRSQPCSGKTAALVMQDCSSGSGPWNQGSLIKNQMSEAFEAYTCIDISSPGPTQEDLSPYNIIVVEGSQILWTVMKQWLEGGGNTALENLANAGASIFVNAAPNQPFDGSFPFGVTLGNPNDGTGRFVKAVSIVNNDLLEPPTNTAAFTANSFSHGIIKNYTPTFQPWIKETSLPSEPVLVGGRPPSPGKGFVAFGAMTTSNFHGPQPDANALRVNILEHLCQPLL